MTFNSHSQGFCVRKCRLDPRMCFLSKLRRDAEPVLDITSSTKSTKPLSKKADSFGFGYRLDSFKYQQSKNLNMKVQADFNPSRQGKI